MATTLRLMLTMLTEPWAPLAGRVTIHTHRVRAATGVGYPGVEKLASGSVKFPPQSGERGEDGQAI